MAVDDSGRAVSQPDCDAPSLVARDLGRSRDSEAERARERPLRSREADEHNGSGPADVGSSAGLPGRARVRGSRLRSPGPLAPLWCEHAWRFDRVSTVSLGDCSRPSVLVCNLCDSVTRVRCKATREEKCAGCGVRHRRLVARAMRSGFRADRPSGFFFVTLTAPGVDGGLLWDQSCGHREGECSGEKGCRVERVPMGIWNSTAPQRWSWFVTELRRQTKLDVQFAGTWETQARGALHRHALIWCAGITDRRFRAAVRLCASRYGFGRQFDVQLISSSDAREQARKAGYCAAYVTKAGERATTMSVETGELKVGGYRTWSASRRWGQTIKYIRAEQRAWAEEHRQGRPEAANAAPGGAVGAGGAAALDLDPDFYAIAPISPPEGVVS